MEHVIRVGRSLEETPTWSVASVTTVMVFLCLIVERSIYRFGKWLKKTRRKALFAALEKIKEELMLLGLISLMLGQCANWISQICVNSSLFSSRFYLCSEEDYAGSKKLSFTKFVSFINETEVHPKKLNHASSHHCGKSVVHGLCIKKYTSDEACSDATSGREPFVSMEGLEQLLRFLFVLGITHVLYSCIAVGLSMSKIYSWRKWENQASLALDANLQARVNKVMRRQSTFVIHHASHPWSRSRVLIWMLCFLRQFKSSIRKSDYLALRSGFISKHKLPRSYNFHKYMVRSMEDGFNAIVGISYPLWGYTILCIVVNVHGLNIYFWLSFVPAILVMLVGTKLQHVVSLLALETVEPKGQFVGTQVKPRDGLFWFRKPEILLWLIQFISFQNAFEMATFLWSLWGFKQRSCFMKNHAMVIIRLVSGVLVQFWCSYSTVPLNVLITQMGSKYEKAVIAASVRESLHSWCKRVKEKTKHDARHSIATRSTCSLDSTPDERDEIITVGSGTLSRSSSAGTLDLDETNLTRNEQTEISFDIPDLPQHEYSFRVMENPLSTLSYSSLESMENGEEGDKVETLFDLFQKT